MSDRAAVRASLTRRARSRRPRRRKGTKGVSRGTSKSPSKSPSKRRLKTVPSSPSPTSSGSRSKPKPASPSSRKGTAVVARGSVSVEDVEMHDEVPEVPADVSVSQGDEQSGRMLGDVPAELRLTLEGQLDVLFGDSDKDEEEEEEEEEVVVTKGKKRRKRGALLSRKRRSAVKEEDVEDVEEEEEEEEEETRFKYSNWRERVKEQLMGKAKRQGKTPSRRQTYDSAVYKRKVAAEASQQLLREYRSTTHLNKFATRAADVRSTLRGAALRNTLRGARLARALSDGQDGEVGSVAPVRRVGSVRQRIKVVLQPGLAQDRGEEMPAPFPNVAAVAHASGSVSPPTSPKRGKRRTGSPSRARRKLKAHRRTASGTSATSATSGDDDARSNTSEAPPRRADTVGAAKRGIYISPLGRSTSSSSVTSVSSLPSKFVHNSTSMSSISISTDMSQLTSDSDAPRRAQTMDADAFRDFQVRVAQRIAAASDLDLGDGGIKRHHTIAHQDPVSGRIEAASILVSSGRLGSDTALVTAVVPQRRSTQELERRRQQVEGGKRAGAAFATRGNDLVGDEFLEDADAPAGVPHAGVVVRHEARGLAKYGSDPSLTAFGVSVTAVPAEPHEDLGKSISVPSLEELDARAAAREAGRPLSDDEEEDEDDDGSGADGEENGRVVGGLPRSRLKQPKSSHERKPSFTYHPVVLSAVAPVPGDGDDDSEDERKQRSDDEEEEEEDVGRASKKDIRLEEVVVDDSAKSEASGDNEGEDEDEDEHRTDAQHVLAPPAPLAELHSTPERKRCVVS